MKVHDFKGFLMIFSLKDEKERLFLVKG